MYHKMVFYTLSKQIVRNGAEKSNFVHHEGTNFSKIGLGLFIRILF